MRPGGPATHQGGAGECLTRLSSSKPTGGRKVGEHLWFIPYQLFEVETRYLRFKERKLYSGFLSYDRARAYLAETFDVHYLIGETYVFEA